ncbi:YdeI/OmpD-associated family protein [Pararhodobacter sp.]|uniref:YdeI/OmpD-associated family protein n=1 Tax=Pararhodobacter sp. TaxID=2127056 RepID=UPI002FDDB27D
MTDPQETALGFVDATALYDWFAANHASADELWIRIYRKASGHPSVKWDDCVRASLAWGWIDGLKRSAGDTSWFQRITPRRARSNWSARNVEIAKALIASGAMQPAGLAQVNLARRDGRWRDSRGANIKVNAVSPGA